MTFGEIYGNDALKSSLAKMVDGGRVGHAILFIEEDGMGALPFSIALTQYLMCNNRINGESCNNCPSCRKISKLIHPDLHFAFPVNSTKGGEKNPISDHYIDKWRSLVLSNPYLCEQDLYTTIGIQDKVGNISVHEAKSIISKLSLKPFEADYKVMVIHLAEKMNAEASNKLLKLIEEPPAGTIFILTTKEPTKILPTILSRCQIVRLCPMQREALADILNREQGVDIDDAMVCAKIAGGSYGKALNILQNNEGADNNRELLERLIELALQKNLLELITHSERLAALSKERQREFCVYAQNYIRSIFMRSMGLDDISFIYKSQREYIDSIQKRINPKSYEKIIAALDIAISGIDSNVSAKLTFCDLCNRFYYQLPAR